MRFSRTASRITAAAVAAMLLAFVGGSPVSAAPATPTNDTPPTWTLADGEQRLCVTPNDPRGLYYFVILDGTWSAPITAGYTGMPDGVKVYSPAPLPPGSGDGHRVQTAPGFRVNGVALGRYTPGLWATDGTVTQSLSVVLDVQSSC